MTGGGATGVAEALQGNYRAGQDEHVGTLLLSSALLVMKAQGIWRQTENVRSS